MLNSWHSVLLIASYIIFSLCNPISYLGLRSCHIYEWNLLLTHSRWFDNFIQSINFLAALMRESFLQVTILMKTQKASFIFLKGRMARSTGRLKLILLRVSNEVRASSKPTNIILFIFRNNNFQYYLIVYVCKCVCGNIFWCVSDWVHLIRQMKMHGQWLGDFLPTRFSRGMCARIDSRYPDWPGCFGSCEERGKMASIDGTERDE